ncbi:MAG: hypothetical protein HYR56_31490 [Acidobacteria bacterium]|nr:hypothetical protein [Acidobacteriota bacterium]MBI3424882.1 hypothetical protein [Acidobacteriota bacterium]
MAEITVDYLEGLAVKLPAEEQKQLIERLKFRLAANEGMLTNGAQLHSVPDLEQAVFGAELERKPRDLYGIWRGQVDEDFDIDKALYEIRHEWEKGLEELGR